MAIDASGNLYITDTRNYTIRKLSPAATNWTVATLAGQAGVGGTNNGTGTNALFFSPGGIAVDQSGRLYVADTLNQTVRLLTLTGTNWVVSTIAGTPRVTGNTNGTNTKALFSLPSGITVDASNNVFVADTGNSAVRKIVPSGSNWIVTTLVSNRVIEGIAVAGANTLVASDGANNLIVDVFYSGEITNLAGIAEAYGGANGAGSNATFNFPQGVAMDNQGYVYIADSLNNIIRKITPVGMVSTLAGLSGGPGYADGSNALASFYLPRGLATDGQGGVYVADSGNHIIRKATLAGTNWVVETLAGSAGSPGDADGTNDNAQFAAPNDVALSGNNHLFVADLLNNEIREIIQSGTNWSVTTFAGRSGVFYSGNITNLAFVTNVVPGATNVIGYTNISFAFTNHATITNYSGVVTNSTANSTNVEFVVTNIPAITNLVGGSPVLNTNLTENLFTLTNVVHYLDGSAGLALFSQPSGLGFDNFGNLYVADAGNNCIRKITTAGQVSTFAGSALTNGAVDGLGTNALFFHPSALVLDGTGDVFVADTENCTIREITPAGQVTTLAGRAGFSGAADGTNSSARFASPQAITIDNSGDLFVTDATFHTIRELTHVGTNWVVTTVGGVAGVHGSYDGLGTNALFFAPQGLAMDASGNLYLADTQNNTLRLGQPAQVVPPAVRITHSAGQVILSWPASAAGYTLETTGNLSPGAAWVPLTNGVVLSGPDYVWTNHPGATNAFYRLHER